MPFKSEKQRRWMYANKPEMAKRWSAEYHQEGGLLGGLTQPTASTPEELQQVIAARNAELANVSRELGVDTSSPEFNRTATTQDVNQIGQGIWGEGAALRKGSAAENANQLAQIVGELGWNQRNQPASNAIEPAEQQGFFGWAGDQITGAAGAAGNAFQQVYDQTTGQTAAQEYEQELQNMSPEQLLEVLNQRTQQGVPPTQAPPADSKGWFGDTLDTVGGALSNLNPISDANASSRQVATGAALAGLPNPALMAPAAQGGINPALVGAEALVGGGGSGAVPVTANERIGQTWRGAQDDSARQTYNKGFLGVGRGWAAETPEQIKQRQLGDEASFAQHTGWNIPDQQHQGYLHQQFGQEAQNPGQFQSQDRDYWGGGGNEANTHRTVTTLDGNQANAATAQGDLEIQNILNDPSYDLAPVAQPQDDDDDHGWDHNPAASSPGSELDFDDSGVDWDSIYDTGGDDGGSDDSGGGK